MWFVELESGPIRVLYAEQRLVGIINRSTGQACRLILEDADVLVRQRIFFTTGGWNDSFESIPLLDEFLIRQIVRHGLMPPLEAHILEIAHWAEENRKIYRGE